MKRISEEYDDYEPEIPVWPLVILALVLPLIPLATFFIISYTEKSEGSLVLVYNLSYYLLIAFPLIITAFIVRNGRGQLAFIFSSALYVFFVLALWCLNKLGAKTLFLDCPIATALSPAMMGLLSYSFYSKRRRLNLWGLIFIINVVLLVSLVMALRFFLHPEGLSLLFYLPILLMLFISIMILFVTRRSEACPWYINIPLSFLVLSAFVTNYEFIALVSDINLDVYGVREIVLYLLREVAGNYLVWYYISFAFVFSSLGMKSCYKNLRSRKDTVDNPYDFEERTESASDETPERTEGKGSERRAQEGRYSDVRKEREYTSPSEPGRTDSYYREDSLPYRNDYMSDSPRRSERRFDEDDSLPYEREPRYRDYHSRRNDPRSYAEDERRYSDEVPYRYERRDYEYYQRPGYEEPYRNLPPENAKRREYSEERDVERRRSRYQAEPEEKDKWYNLLKNGIPEDDFDPPRPKR